MLFRKCNIIFSFLCILILVIPFQSLTAHETQIDDNPFTNCYVEISGTMHNDWFAFTKLFRHNVHLGIRNIEENHWSFVFGYTLYDKADTCINIFDKKNGELLWEYQSDEDTLVLIFGFNGQYIVNKVGDNLPAINYSGECSYFKVVIRNFPWYKFNGVM